LKIAVFDVMLKETGAVMVAAPFLSKWERYRRYALLSVK